MRCAILEHPSTAEHVSWGSDDLNCISVPTEPVKQALVHSSRLHVHIHVAREISFIKNHFHQKPLSSKTTFIKKPLSSKTSFIKDHFHQKPISSEPFSSEPFSSETTSCQRDPGLGGGGGGVLGAAPAHHHHHHHHPSKNNIDRVCVKASRAEGPRRLHTNTANAHLWGLSRLRVQRWVLRF